MVGFIASPPRLRREAMDAELCAVVRQFCSRGWAPAMSSVCSWRAGDDGAFVITAAGVERSELGPEHMLLIGADGQPQRPGELRAPDERSMHAVLYRRNPDVRAVMQTHSPAAVVLSRRRVAAGAIEFEGYEMLRALPGSGSDEATVVLPILAAGAPAALAAAVGEVAARQPGGVALLIAGNGLLAWGESIAAARRHVEAWEFLLECRLREGP